MTIHAIVVSLWCVVAADLWAIGALFCLRFLQVSKPYKIEGYEFNVSQPSLEHQAVTHTRIAGGVSQELKLHDLRAQLANTLLDGAIEYSKHKKSRVNGASHQRRRFA